MPSAVMVPAQACAADLLPDDTVVATLGWLGVRGVDG